MRRNSTGVIPWNMLAITTVWSAKSSSCSFVNVIRLPRRATCDCPDLYLSFSVETRIPYVMGTSLSFLPLAMAARAPFMISPVHFALSVVLCLFLGHHYKSSVHAVCINLNEWSTTKDRMHYNLSFRHVWKVSVLSRNIRVDRSSRHQKFSLLYMPE
jgi:hypothetical protein